MLDKVEIRIGDKTISSFTEYEADSDLLTIADAFRCRTGKLRPEEAIAIKAGARFYLYVNRTLEMNGIIDRTRKTHSKGELSAAIEGRDLGGIIVDACLTNWNTIPQKNLRTLARQLLGDLPFISSERVVFEKGADAAVQKAFKKAQYCPGHTVASALTDYCQRLGLIFWIEPDGSVEFGKLRTSGSPDYSFYLYRGQKQASRNNVLSIEEDDNISKRYSQVEVVGQVQGEDDIEPGGHSIIGKASDKGFPFYKPLVKEANPHMGSVKSQAVHETLKRKAEGYRITVTAPRHGQDGKNFRANRIAFVEDDALGVRGNFLVLKRTFRYDKRGGQRTEMTLGLPMEGYSVH